MVSVTAIVFKSSANFSKFKRYLELGSELSLRPPTEIASSEVDCNSSKKLETASLTVSEYSDSSKPDGLNSTSIYFSATKVPYFKNASASFSILCCDTEPLNDIHASESVRCE